MAKLANTVNDVAAKLHKLADDLRITGHIAMAGRAEELAAALDRATYDELRETKEIGDLEELRKNPALAAAIERHRQRVAKG